ncbi:hypothetical protein HBJ16_000426, partial [Pseudomonas sp. CES]
MVLGKFFKRFLTDTHLRFSVGQILLAP